tara:strand:+ start:2113 stop:2484 length:372 start_codon:yes stop_codon:yes gene_type:complete
MKLTGKCKEDFEKWFEPPLKENEKDPWGIALYGSMVAEFYSLTESMQYGVYVDFFDIVKINVDLQPVYNYTKENYSRMVNFIINVIELGKLDEDYKLIEEKNRPKARTTAIEKADEIYNKTIK